MPSDQIDLARLAAAPAWLDHEDECLVATLCEPLTEVVTLSVGHTVLAGATGTLDSVHQPAIAVDRRGVVLKINAEADALFDDELRVRNGRLVARDRQAQRRLDDLLQKLAVAKDSDPLTAEPILIRRDSEAAVLVRLLSVPAAARSPLLGARALLIFTVLQPNPGPSPDLLIKAFNLSPAEARLASIIAAGVSPEEAAEQLGIARETARNQLKAVFAKTGTHRQGELIALLAKL